MEQSAKLVILTVKSFWDFFCVEIQDFINIMEGFKVLFKQPLNLDVNDLLNKLSKRNNRFEVSTSNAHQNMKDKARCVYIFTLLPEVKH